jgi:pimeloyl-ACP methyl ester carboxylesterase
MIEQPVSFKSDGYNIAATLRIPDGQKAGEKRPAFIVLHGFGSNRNAGNVMKPCDILEKLGYVTLRFDMRGCGESEGERGRLICLEQVQDTVDALGFLSAHPQVKADRIGLIGSSYGAAVAIATAARDKRAAAVISCSGWGHGERKFRGQHPTPEAWAKFTKMLADEREHFAKTGKHMMVPRYDIIPIPPHLQGHLAQGSVMSFTADTAQSIFDFRPEDMIKDVAPRPILLLHAAVDSVTPTEQSIGLFLKSAKPTDLHLFPDADHFVLAEGNTRVHTVLQDWLNKYFPHR